MQQQYAVTFTLPLTLSAANLTDAQTQADALLTSSNATEALAAAVAAGLISGGLYGPCCWMCVGFSFCLPVQISHVHIVCALGCDRSVLM